MRFGRYDCGDVMWCDLEITTAESVEIFQQLASLKSHHIMSCLFVATTLGRTREATPNHDRLECEFGIKHFSILCKLNAVKAKELTPSQRSLPSNNPDRRNRGVCALITHFQVDFEHNAVIERSTVPQKSFECRWAYGWWTDLTSMRP